MLTKTTVLHGFFASGDCECFCFDKRTFEQAMQEMSDACDTIATTDSGTADPHDGKRVYPEDLLPEHGRKRGRWTITVTFEPESDSKSARKPAMGPADVLREFADALETFGPEATEAEMDPAISAVIGRATPETAAATLVVLANALDRLRRHPTPAQGAEELRRLADEIEPPVEVNVTPIPDGCFLLGDPPPEGPPFSRVTGGPFLA